MEGAARLVQRAQESLRSVDILVVTDPLLQGPWSLTLTEEQWEALTAVRLKAIFAATRHASLSMREKRWGRIILLTAPPGKPAEGLAEDGVPGFTRVCARDLGRYGVTVNCIALFGAAGPSAALSPLAEATASLALWLASEEAGHVNGQLFFVASDLIGLLGSPSPERMLQKGAGRWTVREIADAYPLALGSG
jgi:NAD(P)-dependent dehydrogenase (short-subunit alcohol dehydrogenase family)